MLSKSGVKTTENYRRSWKRSVRVRTSAQNAESLASGFEQELKGKTKALEAEAAELKRVLEKFTSTEEEAQKREPFASVANTNGRNQ